MVNICWNCSTCWRSRCGLRWSHPLAQSSLIDSLSWEHDCEIVHDDFDFDDRFAEIEEVVAGLTVVVEFVVDANDSLDVDHDDSLLYQVDVSVDIEEGVLDNLEQYVQLSRTCGWRMRMM